MARYVFFIGVVEGTCPVWAFTRSWQVLRAMMVNNMGGFNPIRRNRNIGTAKSGHGQDNRMTIPKIAHGSNDFWE
jgi:hypothetical protein